MGAVQDVGVLPPSGAEDNTADAHGQLADPAQNPVQKERREPALQAEEETTNQKTRVILMSLIELYKNDP